MIQLLLMLLGFISTNNTANTTKDGQTSVIVQSSTDLEESLETGGDTIPLPPKK